MEALNWKIDILKWPSEKKYRAVVTFHVYQIPFIFKIMVDPENFFKVVVILIGRLDCIL